MPNSELSFLVSEFAEGKLSRRGFLRQATLAGVSVPAATSILSACGDSAEGDQSGTLNVAYYAWIGDVADWLPEVKNRFEEEHPDITVRLAPLAADETTSGALTQKYALEARQQKASADLIMGTTPFIEIGPLAQAEAIQPVGELLPDSFRDRLPEPVEQEITYQGDIYAIPFWEDVLGFIYRTDLLAEHLDSQEGPGTWEEVVEFCERLDPALPNDHHAYGADWSFIHRLFLPIFVTTARQPFTEDGTVNMQDPAALEALDLIRTLHGFMPAGSENDLGSAEVFQAGRVAMESYWQAQYFRAEEAGLDPEALAVTGNPRGDVESTIFWSTSAAVHVGSDKPDLAVEFLSDFFLNDEGVDRSIADAGRILPFLDVEDRYPEWMRPLYQQLLKGTPLPTNNAYEEVEQPTWQTEAGRMLLEGQSAQETAERLHDAFAEYSA